MIVKTESEINSLKESGKILKYILTEIKKEIKEGMSTMDISLLADQYFENKNAKSAFLGYKPEGAVTGFPSCVCVSVNEEIAHGVPKKNKILKSGDVVSVDCGVEYNGFFTDAAFTVAVSDITEKNKNLLQTSSECLSEVKKEIKTGVRVNEIGKFIDNFVRNRGFFVVSELGGHGIGNVPHENPFIFNFYNKDNNYQLSENEIIAIEPIISTRDIEEIKVDEIDGFTYFDPSGSISCHFEHTFIVTKNGAVSITGESW